MNEIGKRLLKRLLQDLRYNNSRVRNVMGKNPEYTAGYERILSEAEEELTEMSVTRSYPPDEDYTIFVTNLKNLRDQLYKEQPHKGYGATQAVLDIFSHLEEPV